MYAQGFGIEKNFIEAHEWLQRAADQGHQQAQKSLVILQKKMASSQIKLSQTSELKEVITQSSP